MSFRSTLFPAAPGRSGHRGTFRHVQTYVVQDRGTARLPRALGEPANPNHRRSLFGALISSESAPREAA